MFAHQLPHRATLGPVNPAVAVAVDEIKQHRPSLLHAACDSVPCRAAFALVQPAVLIGIESLLDPLARLLLTGSMRSSNARLSRTRMAGALSWCGRRLIRFHSIALGMRGSVVGTRAGCGLALRRRASEHASRRGQDGDDG